MHKQPSPCRHGHFALHRTSHSNLLSRDGSWLERRPEQVQHRTASLCRYLSYILYIILLMINFIGCVWWVLKQGGEVGGVELD